MNSQSAATMLGGQLAVAPACPPLEVSSYLPFQILGLILAPPDKENSARDLAPGQEAKGIGVLS
jgi:hypothetical protein